MKIIRNYKTDSTSVMDLCEGTVFRAGADQYLKVSGGWILLGEERLTAFTDDEFKEFEEDFRSVTVLHDLTVTVTIERKVT